MTPKERLAELQEKYPHVNMRQVERFVYRAEMIDWEALFEADWAVLYTDPDSGQAYTCIDENLKDLKESMEELIMGGDYIQVVYKKGIDLDWEAEMEISVYE